MAIFGGSSWFGVGATFGKPLKIRAFLMQTRRETVKSPPRCFLLSRNAVIHLFPTPGQQVADEDCRITDVDVAVFINIGILVTCCITIQEDANECSGV